MIHAFISSRLDYSNAHFTGLSKKTTERLKLIQSSAAWPELRGESTLVQT